MNSFLCLALTLLGTISSTLAVTLPTQSPYWYIDLWGNPIMNYQRLRTAHQTPYGFFDALFAYNTAGKPLINYYYNDLRQDNNTFMIQYEPTLLPCAVSTPITSLSVFGTFRTDWTKSSAPVACNSGTRFFCTNRPVPALCDTYFLQNDVNTQYTAYFATGTAEPFKLYVSESVPPLGDVDFAMCVITFTNNPFLVQALSSLNSSVPSSCSPSWSLANCPLISDPSTCASTRENQCTYSNGNCIYTPVTYVPPTNVSATYTINCGSGSSISTPIILDWCFQVGSAWTMVSIDSYNAYVIRFPSANCLGYPYLVANLTVGECSTSGLQVTVAGSSSHLQVSIALMLLSLLLHSLFSRL